MGSEWNSFATHFTQEFEWLKGEVDALKSEVKNLKRTIKELKVSLTLKLNFMSEIVWTLLTIQTTDTYVI